MIRRARNKDIPGLAKLLLQVQDVHAKGRPDLFKSGGRKYTDDDLEILLHDETRPVFVSTGANNEIEGYAFCIVEPVPEGPSLQPVTTLYIDDICVDEEKRRHHIATGLYEYVRAYAKSEGFDRITLNVWAMNSPAQRFYEKMGMQPLKTTMEERL